MESWDGANVKQWIKFIGFAKYKKQFATIDGKVSLCIVMLALNHHVPRSASPKWTCRA